MRTPKIIRPTESFRNGTVTLELDMRVTSRQGKELAELISDSVENTQKYFQTQLPSVLIVTQQQFASLNNYTEEMYNTTDRMYITKWGVMEVVIDREIDLIPELDEIIESSEKLLNEKENTDDTKD